MPPRAIRTTTRLPADAIATFPHITATDLKPFGKKGGKIAYLDCQGTKLRLQFGSIKPLSPITMPYGISEPYNEDQQGQYQPGFGQQQQQQQYGNHQQQQYGNHQQQMGWNNMAPQPQPGQSAPGGFQPKKTMKIVIQEDSSEYAMVDALDQSILQLCSKNWPRWFKAEKSVEQLVETYSRCLKLKNGEGDPVAPNVGTKVDVDEVVVSLYEGTNEVTKEDGSIVEEHIMYPGTVKDICKGSSGRAVVEIVGIWFVGGKFGVQFITRRVDVFLNGQGDEDQFADGGEVKYCERPANIKPRGASNVDDGDVSDQEETHKRTAQDAGMQNYHTTNLKQGPQGVPGGPGGPGTLMMGAEQFFGQPPAMQSSMQSPMQGPQSTMYQPAPYGYGHAPGAAIRPAQ